MFLQVPILPDSVVTDSAAVFKAIQDFLPGLAPGFVILIAGFLAGRALWLVKLLFQVMPVVINIPPVKKIADTVQTIWPTISWIVNPVLLMLMGLITTHHIDRAILFSFMSIGVREWMIKSPIPTDHAALQKLKGALVLAIFLFATPCFAQLQQPYVPPKTVKVTQPATPLMDHFKLSIATGYGWREGNYYWASAKPAWLINARFGVQYEMLRDFSGKHWDHRVGLNFVLL